MKSEQERICTQSKCAVRDVLLTQIADKDKEIETAKKQRDRLANFNPDWDMLEVARDSLREHMAICGELKAQIEAKDKEIAILERPYKDLAAINELLQNSPDSDCTIGDSVSLCALNYIKKLQARNESLEKVVEFAGFINRAHLTYTKEKKLNEALEALKEIK